MKLIISKSSKLAMMSLLLVATTTPSVLAFKSVLPCLVSTSTSQVQSTHLSIASTLDQSTFNGNRHTVIDDFLKGPKPMRGGGEWVSNLGFKETYEFCGRSFAGTKDIAGEPMMGWVFDKVKFDSHKEKADLIQFMFSFYVLEGFANNAMVFGKKLPNNALSALTMIRTYDPTAREGIWFKMMKKVREFVHLARFMLSGKLPAFLKGKTEYHKQIFKAIEASEKPLTNSAAKWHKQYGPTRKHWYINAVASNPDYQGQGQGSELMQRVMELADESQMDCYLECANEKNKSFYEKFGFNVVAEKELTCALNEIPLTLYLMVRPHS